MHGWDLKNEDHILIYIFILVLNNFQLRLFLKEKFKTLIDYFFNKARHIISKVMLRVEMTIIFVQVFRHWKPTLILNHNASNSEAGIKLNAVHLYHSMYRIHNTVVTFVTKLNITNPDWVLSCGTISISWPRV